LWRFEFDNDIVVGSDDAYSSGWGLERHGPADDTWGQRNRNGFSLFVARNVPGLGDDGEGGRVVRSAMGFSQIMQTPVDISNPEPQPKDVPWAAVAGLHWSWYSIDNRRLNSFQLFAGCMGPCSGAREVQKLVHEDLDLGDPVRGWHNQLATKALLNLNYAVRRKLLAPSPDLYQRPRLTGDVSVGSQAGVGNFFRVIDFQLELRFGWNLPPGFTNIPDPPGRGIMIDSSPCAPPDRWSFHISVIPRLVYFDHVATLEGGDTENGGFHPGIDYESTPFQVLFGLHLARARFSVHLTYYSYRNQVLQTPTQASLDWANLSLEYRF
jgi:hypothetical protein